MGKKKQAEKKPTHDRIIRRKMPSPDAGGKPRVFKSFKGDTWRAKGDAEWAADFCRKFPEVEATGPGGTWGIQVEALVKKDGSKYRLWFREKRSKKRRRK